MLVENWLAVLVVDVEDFALERWSTRWNERRRVLGRAVLFADAAIVDGDVVVPALVDRDVRAVVVDLGGRGTCRVLILPRRTVSVRSASWFWSWRTSVADTALDS